jgi:hypothetical protein
MNWRRKPVICKIVMLFSSVFLTGCGVKGDPLPPEKPPELGRGRPTYKRATEEIHIEHRRDHDPTPGRAGKAAKDGDEKDDDENE